MLTTFSRLLDCRAVTGDDRLKVTELFFDFGTRRIEYVSLDIGGWFDRTEVLIKADQFGIPDTAEESWPVALELSAVEDAPRWHEEAEKRGSLFALENWPPLVVGPFGSTYSPLLMNAQSHLEAEEAAAVQSHRPVPPRSESDGAGDAPDQEPRELVSHMARATEWIGRPVYGPDGELGKLDDVVVNVGRGRITHLVVSGGAEAGTFGGLVPMDWVRHVVQDSHVVTGVTVAQLHEAPTLHDEDALGEAWSDRIERHYNKPV